MAEQITTADALDALPVGSVVLDAYAAICTRIRGAAGHYAWVRATPAIGGGAMHERPYVPLMAVLYRPDRDLLAEAQAEAWDACVTHLAPVLGGIAKGLALDDNPYRTEPDRG